MRELRYALLGDGSSDRALLYILTWLLRDHGVALPIQAEWAELRDLPNPPRQLADRIRTCLELYDFDLLFVHRDAEAVSHEARVEEIRKVLDTVDDWDPPRAICVVPVRMTEAWLLFDESAIRSAAGDPSGRQPLSRPTRAWDRLPDPKAVLHGLLRGASGLSGRRLRRFRSHERVQRIAAFIGDFSPLRSLAAFQALDDGVATLIRNHAWGEMGLQA